MGTYPFLSHSDPHPVPTCMPVHVCTYQHARTQIHPMHTYLSLPSRACNPAPDMQTLQGRAAAELVTLLPGLIIRQIPLLPKHIRKCSIQPIRNHTTIHGVWHAQVWAIHVLLLAQQWQRCGLKQHMGQRVYTARKWEGHPFWCSARQQHTKRRQHADNNQV